MFLQDNFTNNKNTAYVSLGNYCLTSMLFKENKLKNESYPFDWMVSCIDDIISIFEDDFNQFKNKNNYEIVNNTTKNIKYYSNIQHL
jgi:hypothetical protein